ncbi:FxsB family cyclophane-forming radical SAM/SPASM peptide maturase [Streptomyces sp. NPDC057002]|uniref:FxsB family cyclophane-forming radical SAM/SPASM peptide maturase n=1 Tax=Streptomyces sp. NPDC057002 TaxID=3345992 RepID=UPI00363DEA37
MTKAGLPHSNPASDASAAGSGPALRQFVVKVHSRCDLACDHCYVYEHADQSWRGRPRVMSQDVVAQTAARMAEHVIAHRLNTVHLVLHGGEPLLVGHTRLRRIAQEFRSALDGLCRLDLRLQTNAVRLDEQFCEIFRAYDIKVGVSVDGDRTAHDRHRRFADGRGSYDRVVGAVQLLQESRHRNSFAGILCTIDLENDPLRTYETLLALDPPKIDFLLPHATWNTPPPRSGPGATPYADWLITIAEQWFAAGCPVPVRLFDSVLSLLGGGPSLVESMGTDSVELVVVETDGTFEQADSLKIAYPGAPAMGMTVFSHSLDEVAAHPAMRKRRRGIAGLCTSCRSCSVVRMCGGGLYAHRFRAENGFDNPSVFCRDLKKMISYFQDRPRLVRASRQTDAERS